MAVGIHFERACNETVSQSFVILYLNIDLLVSSNGEKENELFSEVLTSLFKIVRELEHFLPRTHILRETCEYLYSIPITPKSFLSQLKQPSHQHSLHSILPIPEVLHNKKTEMGMCSPLELIAMAMFLPPFQKISEHNHHRYQSLVKSESFLRKRMKVPIEYSFHTRADTTPSVLVYIVLWSDGWDPNRSNKGNRSPVWTATSTLVFIELGVKNKPYLVVTEPLAAGPGKSSHQELFELIGEEKKNK